MDVGSVPAVADAAGGFSLFALLAFFAAQLFRRQRDVDGEKTDIMQIVLQIAKDRSAEADDLRQELELLRERLNARPAHRPDRDETSDR